MVVEYFKPLFVAIAVSRVFVGASDSIKNTYPVGYKPKTVVKCNAKYDASNDIENVSIENPSVEDVIRESMKITTDRLEYDWDQSHTRSPRFKFPKKGVKI